MTITARIEADTVSPVGDRITTFVLTYPRFIHSELMTHRAFSRNAASSRAIPIERMIKDVLENPAMPIHWGKNQSGMQAREEVEDVRHAQAEWLHAALRAVDSALRLSRLGIHKQIANRLLEPFAHITTILTGTDWDGFYSQRLHPDAQPEFRELARCMKEAHDALGTPREGVEHIPFDEPGHPLRQKVAIGRCARVSYLTHDGVRDPAKDVELYERLASADPPHLSPMEHVAVASEGRHANFYGWRSFRNLHGL
jgi:thymidylate synthase ThyX